VTHPLLTTGPRTILNYVSDLVTIFASTLKALTSASLGQTQFLIQQLWDFNVT